jgi:hypothetical protein
MKRVAAIIATALVLVAAGCSSSAPSSTAPRVGEGDVVSIEAAPVAEPVSDLGIRVSDPEPVPMPRVKLSEPGPVPMPRAVPAQPRPAPMPQVQPSEPDSMLLPGHDADGGVLPRLLAGPTPRPPSPRAR